MKGDISVNRLLSGNKHEASVFYRTFAPRLLHLIRSKVQNEKDCEEILQDTLFAFLEAIRDFNGKSSVSTYLFAICRHKIIDYYRRKKVKHIVFSRIPSLESLISPLISAEDGYDEALAHKKIYEALNRLLPQYREVIRLKYLEELPVREIAKKLTISLKSVEMKLFRARKAFVEAFISI